jgi:hypothetical protein
MALLRPCRSAAGLAAAGSSTLLIEDISADHPPDIAKAGRKRARSFSDGVTAAVAVSTNARLSSAMSMISPAGLCAKKLASPLRVSTRPMFSGPPASHRVEYDERAEEPKEGIWPIERKRAFRP